MNKNNSTRQLTQEEKTIALWMLENGNQKGKAFLEQLQNAEATNWRCLCGCSSFKFKVKNLPEAPPGISILGDFIFGSKFDLAGIFIYESAGILSGVEVYGKSGDAPRTLPTVESLRPY